MELVSPFSSIACIPTPKLVAIHLRYGGTEAWLFLLGHAFLKLSACLSGFVKDWGGALLIGY